MLVVYFLSKWLDKKDDYAFEQIWEKRFVGRMRYYMIGFVIYFFLVVGALVELLLWGNDSVLFALFIMFFTGIVYGFYLLRSLLRFLAKMNQRYLLVKSGYRQDTFDKSNVVN